MLDSMWTVGTRMPELFDAAAGGWWRFEDYELRDGYIRPAPGAKLERYDPWADYRARQGKRELQPPYKSLLGLLDSIYLRPAVDQRSQALTESSEASLL